MSSRNSPVNPVFIRWSKLDGYAGQDTLQECRTAILQKWCSTGIRLVRDDEGPGIETYQLTYQFIFANNFFQKMNFEICCMKELWCLSRPTTLSNSALL